MTDGKRKGCSCKWVDALNGKLVRCKPHLEEYKKERAARKLADQVYTNEMRK